MMKLVLERGMYAGEPYYELLSYDPKIKQEEFNIIAKRMKLVHDYFWLTADEDSINWKIEELWNMNVKSEEITVEV
jgi:hypothetical protein